ncbi:acyl carrier protein [Nonomuraea sp. KC401]|uniref:phosphopantetheine-binding protein n=1 Tax=unclassified Nonomuraea TaxID=2593643 RepID=UPI0010FD77CE|nr:MULTISPECIES: acyl carrier protein [unclassified Nonomuraea]NBE97996.1 hypothetical protein [Nonomuraea sp. K271]TLF61828.1 acyl carrier protein [Nonomuraea sp. KC401]
MYDGAEEIQDEAEEIQDELVRMATDILGTPVRPESGLLESGMTSVELITLLERVSARWQVELPVDVLFDRGDLVGVAERVHAATRSATPPPRAAVPVARSAGGTAADRRAMRHRIRASLGDHRE